MQRTVNNVTTADTYADAATLDDPDAVAVVYRVANNSVLMQIKRRQGQLATEGDWDEAVLVPPESNRVEGVNAVRFKSANAGAPAQVGAKLLRPGDPNWAVGVPFLQQVSANGAVAGGGGGGMLAATTIAALNALAGTPVPDGTAGRLELGTTPFDEQIVVYSAALAKWVTPEDWYPLGSVLGSVNGVQIGAAFLELFPNSGNGLYLQPPTLPWSVYDAAGLKPQFRWIGNLSNDGSGIGCQASLRLGYRGMGLGTGVDALVDFGAGSQIDGNAASPSDTPSDTGWKDLPGGATVRTFLIPAPLAKATSTGRGAWHHGSIAVRWLG